MIPKAFGNRFSEDWMDSGAVTPVITAEPTGGKAHLTKQQPGERRPAQTEHVYQKHRRGNGSYFVFFKATYSPCCTDTQRCFLQMGQRETLPAAGNSSLSRSRTNQHGWKRCLEYGRTSVGFIFFLNRPEDVCFLTIFFSMFCIVSFLPSEAHRV